MKKTNTMKEVKIEIVITDKHSDEVIAKRTSTTFEGAEEALGKVERLIRRMGSYIC